MNDIREIIRTDEFKYFVFVYGLKEISKSNLVTLFYDNSARAIIKNLRKARNFEFENNELKVSDIDEFIENNAIDNNLKARLFEIQEQFMKLAADYNYKDYAVINLPKVWGCQNFNEACTDKEFVKYLQHGIKKVVDKIQPIQDIINTL